MLFGHVWGDPEQYEPVPVNFNIYRQQIEAFVGDRWQVLGELRIKQHGWAMEITTDDVYAAIDRHAVQDDGVVEWIDWGPTLN